MGKKKKKALPKLQPREGQRKRVDMHHNTSSPHRKQHAGHDQLVYGHTWGGGIMNFVVFLIKTHKVFTNRKY